MKKSSTPLVVRNDAELKAALAEISPFFEPGAEPLPGSAEEARFLALMHAIEVYENNLWQSMPGHPDLPPWESSGH